MHAFPAEDIDGSGERRGHRGHEHREAPVRQCFNNERGDEGLLNFGQRWLPHILLIPPRQALRQTPKEGVAWQSFEQRLLDALSERSPCRRADSHTDEETDQQHEEQREEMFSGQPCGEQHGERSHQSHDRLHGLEQQQHGEVNRHDDEQATHERVHNKCTELFHRQAFL